eukprot:TRINITY_DN3411_c0_g1_i1.p1 TRINITY_DN3411_c0_g1~~TRINITY_DN3411_c0_g1_i1.p1  ORF type:complete len:455 (-),score=112.68 TRINITY_DN3411_c0_g1_i1:244-1608(-)
MSQGVLLVKVNGFTGLGQKEGKLHFVAGVEKQQIRSKVIPFSSDPRFDQEIRFDISQYAKEMLLTLWLDKDFLGQTMIPLSSVRHQKSVEITQMLERRKWRVTERVQGKVQLVVQFKETEQGRKVGVNDFEVLRVLGRGGFGKVVQVRKKDTGRIYAMKAIKKQDVIARNEVDHTMAEKTVLASINHPFIVNLRYAFQTADKLYLVLDFVNGGELFYHLQRDKRFSEPRAKFYGAEITLALDYLHKHNIVYRDLKPENLLLDSYGHICMTDFGLCKTGLGFGETTTTFCGSLEYLAPEVLDSSSQGYNHAVDWWSLGILLYEMMAGLPPFYSSDQNTMARKILEAPLEFPPHFGEPAKDIIRKFLQRNPTKRLCDGDQIRSHPFYAGINWEELELRHIEPPYVPDVASDSDVSNFDPEFTQAPISETPAQGRLDANLQSNFAGFTFEDTAPVNK